MCSLQLRAWSDSNVFAQCVVYKIQGVSSYISEAASSLLLKFRTKAYFEKFLVENAFSSSVKYTIACKRDVPRNPD